MYSQTMHRTQMFILTTAQQVYTCNYWPTVPHQKTSLVRIRPHSSAHSGDSSTQRPTLPSWPSIRSFTWQGLDTSSWSSSRSLDRPTPQRHWICSCQPLETDRPFYGAMVERRDGPSWLRDDDDVPRPLSLFCIW